MADSTPEHYSNIVAFLATAGIAAPLFKRIKVSPVLGFLGAGVALGPQALAGSCPRRPGSTTSRSPTPSRSPTSPSSASCSCCS
ncbi:MAG: hypothetical protein WDM92_07085 [Caulobacteraceae bacterium]